jgi:hypothetical protein
MSISMPMLMSRETVLGSEEETMDSSNLLVTRLMIGLVPTLYTVDGWTVQGIYWCREYSGGKRDWIA